MQDVNQQLYERKDTPKEFIPVYSIIIRVTGDLYNEGTKNFMCDKTLSEVKKLINEGADIIIADNYDRTVRVNNISLSPGSDLDIEGTATVGSSMNEIIYCIMFGWSDAYDIKQVKTFKYSSIHTNVIKYNLTNIIKGIINNEEPNIILGYIKTTFESFDLFKQKVSNEINNMFYNDGLEDCVGTIHCRYDKTINSVVLFWFGSAYIHIATVNNTGAYTHNTIQIVGQTLYRLSALTVDPIINPKIWIGTDIQYAAIAEKDNNTTYIVKSNT